VLVAPATANFMARAAAGMADDLLAAVLLATPAPVVLCPAMNDRMYAHPASTSNRARLLEIGYVLAGPGVGPLAWGEGEGPGRMLEPDEILAHAGRALEGAGPLSGRRVVVTALTTDADQPSLHALLGDLYARTGLTREADEAYEQARDLADPARR